MIPAFNNNQEVFTLVLFSEKKYSITKALLFVREWLWYTCVD